MSIGKICPKCRSTFAPKTVTCPACQIRTRFKVRVRLPSGGWATKTTFVRREAEAFLAVSQARAQVESERSNNEVPSKQPTLKHVWNRYYAFISNRNRSAIDDFARWHHIEPAFGATPLSSITPRMIQDLLDGLQPQLERMQKSGKKLAPATKHRVFALVRRLFNWAIKMGFYDGLNPCSKVEGVGRYDNTRLRFLSQDELQKLLDSIDTDGNARARLFIKFLLLSGRRRGETYALEWSDIDLQRKTVRFRTTKSGKIQIVPISGAAVQLLEEAKFHPRIGEKVFPFKSGGSAQLDRKICFLIEALPGSHQAA